MNAHTSTLPSLLPTPQPPPQSPPHPAAFQGIWPALLTPLDERLGIDHPALARHARGLIAAGCGGVTLFGTTGEGPSFSVSERRGALEALVAAGLPAERVVVSTSCASVTDTTELTQHATALGVHGCLVLPPFFFKGVDDAGVLASYRWVFDRVADARLRVYLYHIPQVSGVALSHAVIGALLAQYPGTILGIKDSGCQRAPSVALAQAFMPAIQVYVGSEPDLQTLGRLGSRGAISGLANFAPRLVHRLVTQPDGPAADADQARVEQLLAVFDQLPLVPAFKALLADRQQNDGWRRVRPPQMALDEQQTALLRQRLQAFGADPERD